SSAITLDRVIDSAKAADPETTLDLTHFLLKNPLITEKQFYLAFMRILYTPGGYGDGEVISYAEFIDRPIRRVTTAGLNELVNILFAVCSVKLNKVGLMLRRVKRDVDGRE
ncbi:hypothetical protein PFISCL1PPCAC_26899, partial [Pristionchus fissidentatus]